MVRICRFLKALWKYILYGKRVSFHKFNSRLEECEYCDYFDERKWTCTKCGCYVIKKCKMSTETCPEKYWE